MACSDQTKRVVSIAHGAVNFASPYGGNIQESVEFAEVRPGTRKAPCLYLRAYSLRASARWGELVTPIARGTSASLVFTLQKVGESGNIVITLVNMRAGAAAYDVDADPVFVQNMEFHYDSGDTDVLTPIAVA
jgi:hypothetical protein